MTQTTFNAMGTTVELHGDAATLGTARTAFDVFERRFSRFIPDSELSVLNATCESTVAALAHHGGNHGRRARPQGPD